MTESSQISNLDKEESLSNHSDSQISLLDECVENVDSSKQLKGPLMEKKRRKRLNGCYEKLKEILFNSEIKLSKLEKADVLENIIIFVEHLQQKCSQLQQQNQLLVKFNKMNKSSSTLDLDREDSFNHLYDSQISLMGESVVTSKKQSICAIFNTELEKKVIKEVVKNALLEEEKVEQIEDKNGCLEKEIKTLKNDFKMLENDVKKSNENINKKIDDLTLKIDKINNLDYRKNIDELAFELKQLKEGKIVCFSNVPNKWKFIDLEAYPCCEKNCVNTDNPDGFCFNGNGFIQIKSDTNVIYVNCRGEKGVNNSAWIIAENSFNKPNVNSKSSQCCLNCTTFTLFYYEVKFQIEENADIGIGLRKREDLSEDFFVSLWSRKQLIYYYIQGDEYYIKLPFSLKNDDIIGCGLVYPPPKLNNKLPYVFFTQNGKQIGKAILLEKNYEFLEPYIDLECCSAETNFGENLTSKPFIYNISKHCLIEEFYKDEDYQDYTYDEE